MCCSSCWRRVPLACRRGGWPRWVQGLGPRQIGPGLQAVQVLLWPDCDSKREQPTAAERKAVEAQVRGRLPHEAQADDVRNAPYLQAMQALEEVPNLPGVPRAAGGQGTAPLGRCCAAHAGCTVSLSIAQPGVPLMLRTPSS